VEEEALVAQFTSLKNVGLLDGLPGVGMMIMDGYGSKWKTGPRGPVGDHRC